MKTLIITIDDDMYIDILKHPNWYGMPGEAIANGKLIGTNESITITHKPEYIDILNYKTDV